MIREETAVPILFMQECAEKEEVTSLVEWWWDIDCAKGPPGNLGCIFQMQWGPFLAWKMLLG
jgi:hypothetical protein